MINKAIKSYNKAQNSTFKPSDIVLLLAIHHSSIEAGSSYLDIFNYLNAFYHGFPGKALLDKLNDFTNRGLIKSHGTWPVRYSLTFEGSNVLNELEYKCRTTRIDK